ncbi:MAG: O-antigen ligase domain-containing protein [Gammaproteobacteria bacterium]|nr:MAG: O-antigen ligase domain-containing protein [Gammaproteobacteria bacterium]UTW43070.1 O-antigen ligase family protein [bacterium SCSIO 12844]
MLTNIQKIRTFFLYLSAIAFLIPFACFGLGRALTTIPLGIAIVCALIGGDIKGAISYLKTNKFLIPMLLLPLMMYIGIFYTPQPLQENAWSIANKYNWLIFPLLLTPMLICIFNQRNWQLTAYNFFIISAIIIALIGILSTYSNSFFQWILNFTDYQKQGVHSSPLQSHTETGFITALGAFFCVTLLKYHQHYLLKLLYGALWLLNSFYILFINTSKTGLLLYVILLVIFSLQYLIKSWKQAVIGFICLVIIASGAMLLNPYNHSRIERLYSSIVQVDKNADETSFGQRFIMLDLAIKQFKKSPIIGSGTGTPIQGNWLDLNNPNLTTSDPHSEFLFVMTKIGIVGLVLLILYFAMMIYDSLFIIRKGIEANMALGVSISFIFYAFVESILYHNPASYEVAFFVSLLFLSNLKKRS